MSILGPLGRASFSDSGADPPPTKVQKSAILKLLLLAISQIFSGPKLDGRVSVHSVQVLGAGLRQTAPKEGIGKEQQTAKAETEK